MFSGLGALVGVRHSLVRVCQILVGFSISTAEILSHQ